MFCIVLYICLNQQFSLFCCTLWSASIWSRLKLARASVLLLQLANKSTHDSCILTFNILLAKIFLIFENTNLMTCHVGGLLYLCLCQRITSTFWECFWFRSTFPDWFSSLLDLLNIFEGVRQREAKGLGEKEGTKAAKDAEASKETERQELWQRVLKDNRVGEVAADPRSHQASKPGHSAAHTHCWVPASAIVSSLGKPVSFKPDAGRVELGGEHEGDIEGHGCPKLGREGENSIDGCACGHELSQLRDSA